MDATEASLHLIGVVPGTKTKLGVGRGKDDGAGASVEELLQAFAVCADLGRTDERPSLGEENKSDPVVGLVVCLQTDFCIPSQCLGVI
jgi:hypothetical protein